MVHFNDRLNWRASRRNSRRILRDSARESQARISQNRVYEKRHLKAQRELTKAAFPLLRERETVVTGHETFEGDDRSYYYPWFRGVAPDGQKTRKLRVKVHRRLFERRGQGDEIYVTRLLGRWFAFAHSGPQR